MSNLQKISRCLISVSDKTNIVEIAKYLAQNNVEIISTGGTYKLLKQQNIAVKDISQLTNFPEIMDGRIKTLHPKVHAGLLAVLDNKEHQAQSIEHDILSIDLLIVNLYPFVETLAKTNDEAEIIENIDIGGPAMVRSASKNFLFKTVITEIDDYEKLKNELDKNHNSTTFEFRKSMASKAFKNIADYDLAISKWFNNDQYILTGTLKQQLRYGENSHQTASLYVNSDSGIVNATQIQGKELSYNNFNDADASYNLLLEFDQPACVIVKHANPCGVSKADNILQAYKNAFNADSKSAFGGIVALNYEINEDLANELIKVFYEVIIAPKISQKAQEIFATKKNLRLLIADFRKSTYSLVKSISGGFLVQDADNKIFIESDLKLVSKKSVNKEEIKQLIFAMNVCKHLKSNAIVVANNFQTLGLGVGQTNRVDACEIACFKAYQFIANKNNIELNSQVNSGDIVLQYGAYLASDAFFPFADNIEIAGKFGIKAIVAPSGSMRDEEVIAKANELNIALYFTQSRHFKH
jgi:phosphoribosylaminoimidazolecarboxamide formyltransferase/IMP cyclohydrolase